MTHHARPISIVVAEDDADDRLMIKEAFEQCQLDNELQFVQDGEELVQFLRREGDYAHLSNRPYPGLILLDLNMPKMDGRESLRQLKADPLLCRLPVVILTTSQAEEDVEHSYDCGVNSFITKPGSFDQLVETVAVLGDYWIDTVALPCECDSSPYATGWELEPGSDS